MYDIKIFLEDNGEFWARINAWKEVIYWVWKNHNELMINIREWLELSFENKTKTKRVSKLFNYFNESKNNLICH